MSFEDALMHTLAKEGGYTDHPMDPGGRTKYGITEATLLAWAGAKGVEAPDVSDVDLYLAKNIYRDVFWNPMKLDLIVDMDVASELFDTAVNCGIRSAVKMAQRAVNVLRTEDMAALEVDGALGPRTACALNQLAGSYRMSLLYALNGEQYVYSVSYTHLTLPTN